MDQCRTGGDFLGITMEEICRSQGVTRWAECTPDHLLYLPEIAEQFQDASVIHIIRDGHDVALSNVRQGWLRPLSWDRSEHLTVAGLYWEWSVRKGMQYGKALGARYCQVRFLDLVSKPRQVLWRLGRFIGHELDYDRIVKTGIGSVSSPNSSFPSEACKEGFPPAGRWKRKMSPTEVQQFEDVLGDFLQELGYEVTAPSLSRKSLRSQRLRATYLPLFSDKKWLKSKTPLGRLVDVASLTTVPWLNAC
jgi:Sulfotransferase family